MKKNIILTVVLVMVLALAVPITLQAGDKCCSSDSSKCCGADKGKMKDHPADCPGCKAGTCDHMKAHGHDHSKMKTHPEDCEACKAGTCDYAKKHKEECKTCDPEKCACDKKAVDAMMKKDDCKSCESSKCGDKGQVEGANMDVKEGNVWTSAEGKRYYKCPVMKGEGLVEEATSFSVIKGKKYYHCCPPCQGPFRSDPEKWLGELFLPGNIEMVQAGVKTFKDPVNGKTGEVKENTRYYDYEGFRYFFSSKKSLKKFQKDPMQFAGKLDS